MADKKLNSDQQEKLSRIMSMPTKTPAVSVIGSSVEVPSSYKVADLPDSTRAVQKPSQNQSSTTTVVGAPMPLDQKKTLPLLPILLIIAIIIFFLGYAYFWVQYFHLSLPAL